MYFTISTQLQVVLAIVLFYLYDAALLLKPEEGLLRPLRSGWRAQLASRGFELRQKRLLWLPIFVLHRPVYRQRWSATRIHLPGDTGFSTAVEAHACSFRAFALPLYLLAVLLFLGLPAALLVLHSELMQLTALALIYLSTAWLGWLALRHGKQRRSDLAFARSTAFQILLCPPFALNVVRKLSLSYEIQADLLQTAQAHMSASQWQDLAAQVQQLMQREMDEIAELPEYAPTLAQMQQALRVLEQNSARS